MKQKAEPAPRLVILEGVLDNTPKSGIIIAEGLILCSIKSEKDVPLIGFAIVSLIAVFYVFDVKYPQRHINMFNVFDEKLLNFKLKKPGSKTYERFIKSVVS